jgi:hypothetical protein
VSVARARHRIGAVEVCVSVSEKIRRTENTVRLKGTDSFSQLACFVRWAAHGASSGGSGDSHSGKVEVQCRECGSIFVKYAYEKTVRCTACRAIHRKASQEVEK